jgi:dolichol-phosphate mannosyltransferase
MEEMAILQQASIIVQNFHSPIAIVVAALNEESGIGPTIAEIQNVLLNPYLIVVDGNSRDKTVEIAKNLGADVCLQHGIGKGDAMVQGISRLRDHHQFVVFTDADYTYPAEAIPKMVKVLEESPQIGMVIGDRFHGNSNHDKASKNIFYIGNRLIAVAQHILNGVKLSDPLSGLRVVRSELLRGWKPDSKGFDVEVEINAMVGRQGYKIAELPIDYRLRLGEKKLKPRDGLEIFKRVVSISLK